MPETYILHFERPYWTRARHYVGYTKFTAEERLKTHLSGNGSKICNYAIQRGIGFQISLAEQYPSIAEARHREIRLKREGHLSRHCVLCSSITKGASGENQANQRL